MINLKEISQKVNGQLKGNPNLLISSVNSIDKAGEGEITFSVKGSIDYEKVKASALIVKKNSQIDYPNLIYVEEPYHAFAILLEFFFPGHRFNDTIDPRAVVAPGTKIGKQVSIGAFSYVGENCEIGDNSEIHAGVIIYPGAKIGKNCLIYSNVVIREDVEIGNHVIIQPGAVLGADGFGFTRISDGTLVKIPQKGKVVIGDYCEIGANTCIDRSTIEKTVLEDYVKLDNLVQVGHNVRIGRATTISGLTGISGSVDIGENVVMGGMVGIADHSKIDDGVMVAGKTGIHGHVKRGIIAGIPYQDFRTWKKNQAILKNLETYIERIKQLEKKIKELEEKVK